MWFDVPGGGLHAFGALVHGSRMSAERGMCIHMSLKEKARLDVSLLQCDEHTDYLPLFAGPSAENFDGPLQITQKI